MDKNNHKQELDNITKQINELQQKQYELWKECVDEFLEQAKQNIGRCFYNTQTNVYVKIMDVPQYEYNKAHPHINLYQYPAIFVGKDETENDGIIPFYTDTLFSGIWGEGNYKNNPYKEISKEEFNIQFAKVLEQFYKMVMSYGQNN